MNIDELYTVEHHEKGAEMQVEDQLGKKLDMYLVIAGPDSKLFRKTVSKNRTQLTTEDSFETRVRFATDLTIGWRGFLKDGKELKFSKAKVENLYRQAPYLLAQIDRFFANRENFIKS